MFPVLFQVPFYVAFFVVFQILKGPSSDPSLGVSMYFSRNSLSYSSDGNQMGIRSGKTR